MENENLIPSRSWDIAIFEMIILLFLNFSPFCIPMRFQPCRVKLLCVSKRYSMGKMFWTSSIVKNIGELLEAKPHWSELILQFGTSEKIFPWNQTFIYLFHLEYSICRRVVQKIAYKVIFLEVIIFLKLFLTFLQFNSILWWESIS